jgi:hypothetical protein
MVPAAMPPTQGRAYGGEPGGDPGGAETRHAERAGRCHTAERAGDRACRRSLAASGPRRALGFGKVVVLAKRAAHDGDAGERGMTWECGPSIVTVHSAAIATARSLFAFLMTASRTNRPGIACSSRTLRWSAQVQRCATRSTLGPGLAEPAELDPVRVRAGSSPANGRSVAVQAISESEASMGCIAAAGTPGVVSLPMLIWIGACSAWCRWRGVSHLGGSFSAGWSIELNEPPAPA